MTVSPIGVIKVSASPRTVSYFTVHVPKAFTVLLGRS
jgi:hypothetical protein